MTVDTGGARSYDYPVQYEVRIRVSVNAASPEEAVQEARKLVQGYPIQADVIDPRGGLSRILEGNRS